MFYYLLQTFNIKTFAVTFNLIVLPTQEEQLCVLHPYKIPCFSHCAQGYSYFIIKEADSFFTTYTRTDRGHIYQMTNCK